ncbi:helix-turn-helix transcriptional regulator [Streptomyces sp. NPDC051555]|uniref:helix-turn-helix transcriptional regulator n=1 Tax=Streptomyces sp. NPDC051555 TaxID=3365657 RepID=UPI00378A3DC6
MCTSEWRRARVEAQRLADFARLRRVRDRIDREYERPLDVEALAHDVHLAAGQMSRLFRDAYGQSPYAYLMTRRIERATALLRRGDLTVAEVRSAVGGCSPGTFTARFTELVGMPPGDFRRQGEGSGIELEGVPACVSKQVRGSVRIREAPAASRALA